MKITELLKEQFDMSAIDSPNSNNMMGQSDVDDTVRTPSLADSKLQFNDLTIYQVATIRKLGRGALNVDEASEKELNAIEELIDYGILDNNVEFTELGRKALAKSEGGSYDSRRYNELHKNDAKQAKPMGQSLGQSQGYDEPTDDVGEDEIDFSDEPRSFR